MGSSVSTECHVLSEEHFKAFQKSGYSSRITYTWKKFRDEYKLEINKDDWTTFKEFLDKLASSGLIQDHG